MPSTLMHSLVLVHLGAHHHHCLMGCPGTFLVVESAGPCIDCLGCHREVHVAMMMIVSTFDIMTDLLVQIQL